jgi:phosphate transport system ATP-binding protein
VENRITALIGPSGCGKTTFLRALNRMTDLIEDVRVTGKVLIDGADIYAPGVDLLDLRKKVGMVFQRPNPFPLSVSDNVLYGLRVHGVRDPRALDEKLTRSLEAVHLWDELKDRLDENALHLSGEQQQRLCIARLVAVEPEILLMDEPCSALDLAATANIEDLMAELKKRYTILIVTHNMQQAARVSDVTGYFLLGELIEIGETRQIFTNPHDSRTEDYITGRFG